MTFNSDLLDGTLLDLCNYWQGLRPSPEVFPKRASITMQGLRPFLPYISLIEKRQPDDDYYYRLKGTGFTMELGREATGKRVRDVLPDSLLLSLLEGLDHVADTGTPYHGPAAFHNVNGEYKKYTRLILPLSEDGKTINIFLVYGRPEN